MDENNDLIAAAAAAEAEEGRREEEGVLEEDLSSVVRRSQRQVGQKPVNCSAGCRSQLKEDLGGGGAVGCAEMGFITDGS